MINNKFLYALLIPVAVTVLVFLLRIILTFIVKSHLKNIADKKQKFYAAKGIITNKNNFIKEDEELILQKSKIPVARSAIRAEKQEQNANSNYEFIASEEKSTEHELEAVKIVGIVSPIGRWTAKILGEKLSALIDYARANNEIKNNGFWQNMVNAKSRSNQKQRGRSR